MKDRLTIINADVIEGLARLPDESVHCCVTSPPYWGLRDYGIDGQIGLEKTPEEFVKRMVEVFAQVRRVLRKDGVCWVNLGDSYAANRGGTSMPAETLAGGVSGQGDVHSKRGRPSSHSKHRDPACHGLKHKDLCGIPWRVALALQADGWWLRQDIIWHKPNPMPESVTDRCTKAHEYVFMLTKSQRYWWDQAAIREKNGSEMSWEEYHSNLGEDWQKGRDRKTEDIIKGMQSVPNKPPAGTHPDGRNRRSVWTIPSAPYAEAHFATFPEMLPKLCILAACPVGGTVLDPFAGSGTTGKVALEMGRKAVLIEINPDYVKLIEKRTNVTPAML